MRRTVMLAGNFVTMLLKPVTRLIVGAVAIPAVRLVRRRIPRLRDWDDELEKDVEQWFRGSLLLLVATKNTELWLIRWFEELLGVGAEASWDLNQWYITAGRLLLAIGVVESMPDQELFSIIHPGPRWNYDRKQSFSDNLRCQFKPICRGLLCQHLNRSSPVLAILTVFFDGALGWTFYVVAILQYLIIGLVTSRDRALDVLSRFDHAVAERRREIIEEFNLDDAAAGTAVNSSADSAAAPASDASKDSSETGDPPPAAPTMRANQ
ncbi:MAG: DNA topoisomerase I [Planctomycetaceae bacterium]